MDRTPPTAPSPRMTWYAIRAILSCGEPVWRREATAVAENALPLYRDGRCTWPALVAACRALYMDYDAYRPELKAYLLPKARLVLKAVEAAIAPLQTSPRL
jgi:hypothetical protein